MPVMNVKSSHNIRGAVFYCMTADDPDAFRRAREIAAGHQFLVVTQADGRGGMVHNHIILCSVGLDDGKAMRGNEKSWYRAREANDQASERFGVRLDPKLSKSGVKNYGD